MKQSLITCFLYPLLALLLASCGGGSGGSSGNNNSQITGFNIASIDHWRWTNPTPQGNTLWSIAWSDSLEMFAAVGEMGAIVTSQDGINWQPLDRLSYSRLYSIVWANNTFVAVGADGTIVTSIDGVNWELQLLDGFNSILQSVVWTGSTFYASGAFYAFSSNDGMNWSPVNVQCKLPDGQDCSLQSLHLNRVIWAGDQFVGMNSVNIFTSPDGITWTHRYSQPSGFMENISWSGTVFVVVGGDFVLSSNDALAWSEHSLSGSWYDALWSGTQFIIVNNAGGIRYSPDGIQWDNNTSVEDGLFTIGMNSNTFVAAGIDGATYYSNDATNWEKVSAKNETRIREIAKANGKIIAVGYGGLILTSDNGEQWEISDSGVSTDLNAITASDSEIIVVGDGGTILRSTDGIEWSSINSGVINDLMDVVWNNTRFVAAGMSKIMSSTNGLSWQSEPSTPYPLLSIVWTGDQHIAVGLNGTIVTGTIGGTWTIQNSGTTSQLHSVASSGSLHIATGFNRVLISSNGVQWTNNSFTNSLYEISCIDKQFIAVGEFGAVHTTRNGADWQDYSAPVPEGLEGLTISDNKIVVGGIGGELLIANVNLQQ